MIAKFVVIAMLGAIVWCLLSAYWFLLRERGEGTRTVWRLSWRVGLSLLLLLVLWAGMHWGWLEPSTPGPIGLRPDLPSSG